MSDFKSVQEGRHAVRDLLSKAHKAYEGGDEFVAEKFAVDALTSEARNRLQGQVGLSQEQQVQRLAEVGALIKSALTVATVPVAVEALTEAAAVIAEAGEVNEGVKTLAAERDFEAWQEEKAAKRAAAYESDSYDEEDDDEE